MAERGDPRSLRPLPRELSRLDQLLTRGLDATAARWPPIATAYGWVHQAAHLLSNDAAKDGNVVRATYAALLAEMRRHRDDAGPLPRPSAVSSR